MACFPANMSQTGVKKIISHTPLVLFEILKRKCVDDKKIKEW